ncbi:FHA domain-containing protein [Methanoplanus sp. FWC-SCC4]|uniref:FHA domain-containing protein n=1 Tax=Methanochimaera problematica TaxID=2609417 RepID=A0AA97FAA2_9EURY|nr:FHA domain-containing protein [Methanoplanus sp. FWC-SCC4]WOF15457.1 FHA domain-containing protein [Methanoplanus sp. FWC-SCC4]
MPDDTYKTIVSDDESGFFENLSEYLNVLGNPTRLKILKLIENNPKDIREISGGIETSYENTKKHLDKLLRIGIIKKEAGMGKPTSKGIHAVWKYSTIPGGMELVARNIGNFCNMEIKNPDIQERLQNIRKMIDDEMAGDMPVLVLLGGEDDGRAYILKRNESKLGRYDPTAKGLFDEDSDIVLKDSYRAVTRVSKPHAVIFKDKEYWLIKDAGSAGGTFLNNHDLIKSSGAILKDGDMIDLGKGEGKATLVFHQKKSQNS